MRAAVIAALAAAAAVPAPAFASRRAPVLGAAFPSPAAGWGTAHPSSVGQGGNACGSWLTGIHWTGWGKARAVGIGKGCVWNGKVPASRNMRTVSYHLVAFGLGTCNGRRAYTKAVEFAPSLGQRFNRRKAQDICEEPL
jgi:hypothetical protein